MRCQVQPPLLIVRYLLPFIIDPHTDLQIASVQGRFEGQLAANATLQRVAVTCGECSTLNSVEVPRRTYHVVTLGVGGVGIFESQVCSLCTAVLCSDI